MFAAALKETEARDKAQRDAGASAARGRGAEGGGRAGATPTSLAQARRDLDRAIAAVRAAKANGRSTVEADAAWKAAKARVIELETGERPAWAPPPPVDESVDDTPDSSDTAGDVGDGADESPVDAGAVGEEQS